LDRLAGLRFSLDDESNATFVDALRKVREALDVPPEKNLFARRPWYAERSDALAVATVQGDADALDAFILLHRPLARHISKRLQRVYGMEADDAEQIAVIGLIHAARRFDPERGIQFSTYATYWIRRACLRLGSEAALPIRLPAHVLRTFFPLRRRIEKLASESGPGRANDELAHLSFGNERFFRQWTAFERALNVRSLSDRHEPEYFEARTLEAPVDGGSLEATLHEERVESLRAAMRRLNPRQSRLLRSRYGMEGEPQTLQQIGETEGITRERVRQILEAAKRKLRRSVERTGSRRPVTVSQAVLDHTSKVYEEISTDSAHTEPSGSSQPSVETLVSSGVPVLA
jgi:RNA polymerase sigma factor (sigma-70 family)